MRSLEICLLAIAPLFLGCVSDRTRGKSQVCEVHKVRMAKTTVPIRYGLPPLESKERIILMFKTFPHAEESVNGGCVRTSASRAVVFTCDVCKVARQKWADEMKDKQPEIAKPEPPPPVSTSNPPVLRTLDSLPAPGSSGGR